MSRRFSKTGEMSHHPFRSMFDLMLALVFFLLTAILLLKGNINARYIKDRDYIADSINVQFKKNNNYYKPILIDSDFKNDPVGTQRWFFPGNMIFMPGTTKLSDDGKYILKRFAEVLRPYEASNANVKSGKSKWRRIRVEGHTWPSKPEKWDRSADMAIAVIKYLSSPPCNLKKHVLAGAFRGGQDTETWVGGSLERVEIIIEFTNRSYE